jgi:hypothetical protein
MPWLRHFRQTRLAVYTAIYGGHDELKPQPVIPGVDYVCFTDDPTMRSDQWRVVCHAPRFWHPRLAAKYYKMRPDVVLPDYAMTLWLDAHVRVVADDFYDCFVGIVGDAGVVMFANPERRCIYDEAAYCGHWPKYRDQPIAEQVGHYRGTGYPEDHGLYACGVIARDSRIGAVRRLGRRWLRENVRWTYQDQISLPYVLWKLNLSPAVFRHDLWKNPWLEFHPHRSEM